MLINSLVNLLIWLVIIGILLGVVFWVLDAIPVPQPFYKIIRVVAIVVAALIVILLLLQLVGITVPNMAIQPIVPPT